MGSTACQCVSTDLVGTPYTECHLYHVGPHHVAHGRDGGVLGRVLDEMLQGYSWDGMRRTSLFQGMRHDSTTWSQELVDLGFHVGQ